VIGADRARLTFSRSGVTLVSWDQRFFDPIMLPSREPLVTLRDAAQYITKLPKAEHDAEEWQAAMQSLLLVAEHDGPTMFARTGIMQAFNRHVERVFNPPRKDKHWDGESWRGISDGARGRRRNEKSRTRVEAEPAAHAASMILPAAMSGYKVDRRLLGSWLGLQKPPFEDS
jgi:hypothetical protein